VLLARRLIEAGARFVTINHVVQGGLFGNGVTDGTWDNHQFLFDSMMSGSPPTTTVPGYKWHAYQGPGNLPQLDMSLSALLDDLDERGLLETTLVVVMGEFGRTPRINKDGGRDHYPNAGNRASAFHPFWEREAGHVADTDMQKIKAANSPRFDPNLNTGHAFRADQEQRVARNTVHFSEEHPSQIVLPVYRDQSTAGR
jgi:hypothetical protein